MPQYVVDFARIIIAMHYHLVVTDFFSLFARFCSAFSGNLELFMAFMLVYLLPVLSDSLYYSILPLLSLLGSFSQLLTCLLCDFVASILAILRLSLAAFYPQLSLFSCSQYFLRRLLTCLLSHQLTVRSRLCT